MKPLVTTLLVVSLMTFGALQANANPVKYTFSATDASGTLGGQSFSNVDLKFTIGADTDNITQIPAGPDTVFGYPTDLDGSFHISGLGMGSITPALFIFNNQTTQAVGFGAAGLFSDILDIVNRSDGLGSYRLGYPFGPITSSSPRFGAYQPIGTSRGDLILTGIGSGTFEASVPEPSALGLLGVGLLMIGVLRYRQTRR
jgi:hypothetical protein